MCVRQRRYAWLWANNCVNYFNRFDCENFSKLCSLEWNKQAQLFMIFFNCFNQIHSALIFNMYTSRNESTFVGKQTNPCEIVFIRGNPASSRKFSAFKIEIKKIKKFSSPLFVFWKLLHMNSRVCGCLKRELQKYFLYLLLLFFFNYCIQISKSIVLNTEREAKQQQHCTQIFKQILS